MKILIVFFGLLTVHAGFLVYHGDLGRYVRCQAELKALAEECAAGAALYYDQEEYARGKFVFMEKDGQRYASFLLAQAKHKMSLPSGSLLDYEMRFQDDRNGYEPRSDGKHYPAITVTLTADTGNLFTLPFFEVRQVVRATKYELPHSGR